MMKVVEPSPSSETTPASTAVNTTSRTGSLPNRPQDEPDQRVEQPDVDHRAEVDDREEQQCRGRGEVDLIESMMESTTPSSAGAPRPVAGHDESERQRDEDERERRGQPFGQDQVHEHGDHGEAEADEHLCSLSSGDERTVGGMGARLDGCETRWRCGRCGRRSAGAGRSCRCHPPSIPRRCPAHRARPTVRRPVDRRRKSRHEETSPRGRSGPPRAPGRVGERWRPPRTERCAAHRLPDCGTPVAPAAPAGTRRA